MQTDRVPVWGALPVAHFLFGIVLHTTRVVAVGSAFSQRACDAPCRVYVMLKQAVRVIKNKLPRRLTLLTTPRIPPPAHRRGRGPPWRMYTNFRR